jgi:hypothetical protein
MDLAINDVVNSNSSVPGSIGAPGPGTAFAALGHVLSLPIVVEDVGTAGEGDTERAVVALG